MPKLHRTNINLYEEDVEWLQKTYGYGWTERVREMLHKDIQIQIEEGVGIEDDLDPNTNVEEYTSIPADLWRKLNKGDPNAE